MLTTGPREPRRRRRGRAARCRRAPSRTSRRTCAGTSPEGSLARRYVTISDQGVEIPTLIIGQPVRTAGRDLEFYLLFPLDAEQRTLSLVQSTLIVGGLVLLLLLAGIASLVTRQVVRPVRQAAEIAERFADGHLDERMPVHGDDEVARLAESYNEMAGSIQTQIRQLEEFGALQRRFTSDVSHELRTPLTTVRMAADVLHASKDQLLPALRRSSELLVTELDRFEALLADLLEISRLDAGVADLTADRVDMHGVVTRRGRGRARASPTRPARRCGCTCPSGCTPRSTRGGSSGSCATSWRTRSTTARAGRSTSRWPATSTRSPWWCATTAWGCGRARPALVFNRFWRAEESRARRSGGSGLGLSISIEDARLHGGLAAGVGRARAGLGVPADAAAHRRRAARRPARCRWCRTTAPRARACAAEPAPPSSTSDAAAGSVPTPVHGLPVVRPPRAPRRPGATPVRAATRPASALLVLLLVLAGLAGCASVPESSPVQVLRRVGDGDAPVLPPGPVDGSNALDLVRGFVYASGSSPDRHGAARRFLAPEAAGLGRRRRRHRARRAVRHRLPHLGGPARRTCAPCASAAPRWAG